MEQLRAAHQGGSHIARSFSLKSPAHACDFRTLIMKNSAILFLAYLYLIVYVACYSSRKVFCEMSEKEEERSSKKRLNICGPNLKRIRLERHLTLVDIQATLELDYGIALDRTNLGRIENGERTVTDVELAVLAHLLDVSLEYLLWGGAPPDARQIDKALEQVKIRYAHRRTSQGENA
jgi:transcriptional regulator with XRE-family HTH domain